MSVLGELPPEQASSFETRTANWTRPIAEALDIFVESSVQLHGEVFEDRQSEEVWAVSHAGRWD